MFGRNNKNEEEKQQAKQEQKQEPLKRLKGMIDAKDIVYTDGKVKSLEQLPEPYLFLYDTGAAKAQNLAIAVNILAAEPYNYRVVTHAMDALGVAPHYVCMIKEDEEGGSRRRKEIEDTEKRES